QLREAGQKLCDGLFIASCSGQSLLVLSRFLQGLVDAEAGRPLARGKLLECFKEFTDRCLGRNQCKQAVSDPLIVEHRGVFVSPLEGVATQVGELWCAQLVEGFQPDSKPVRALLEEMNLPVFISQCHQVTVIAPVKETLARVFLHLSLEKGQQVVPVDVNLEV